MINRKSTIAAVALGAFSLSAHAVEVALEGAETGKWTMDFAAAKKLAAEKELPLLLNFTGSDWCFWCKLMDENVFAKDDWKEFAAENVVLVTLDFPKDKSIVPEKYVERNEELKSKFGVRGYPTYVILDSDAETKIGQLGAGREKTPSMFIEEFKNVVRMSDASIEAYVKANPDKADAYKAAVEEVKEARDSLTAWLETNPERNDENTKMFEEFNKRIKEAENALSKF